MAKPVGYGYFMVQTLIIHVIFLVSIFDIYFTSPLLHGMEHHTPKINSPPAKRLVLFIADGLRADKCFDERKTMPFLRDKALKSGVWRVSKTRAPTESRVGHVVIGAGFYEDVSALTTGWQENPVAFDTVFNQSYKTWAFAKIDVVGYFTKGNSKNNIVPFYFPKDVYSLGYSVLTAEDDWPTDKVEQFFSESKSNETVKTDLNQEKTIFFVYLPGADTIGHKYNSVSKEAFITVHNIDADVKRITKAINSFYRDNNTAYLLTSDHGMTPSGGHGSGLEDEILTPMVAWGSGVANQKTLSPEKMSIRRAENISQADITPFMSALLGMNIPVNSVGNLHTDLLSVSMPDKSELKLTNTLQIVEQFKVSLEHKRMTTIRWLFRPYPSLSISDTSSMLRDIRLLIQSGRYEQSISDCSKLIDLALDSIIYYHKYDRVFLRLCITLGLVGWMVYTLLLLMEDYSGNVSGAHRAGNLSSCIWWLSRALIMLTAYGIGMPWSHILYCLVPTFPLQYIFERRHILIKFISDGINDLQLTRNIFSLILVVIGLELMVHSFFDRRILSLAMLLLAATDYKRYDWLICCLMLSVFPMLPVVGRGSNYYFVISCGTTAVLASLYFIKTKTRMKYFQVTLLVIANLVVIYTSYSTSQGEGLPFLSQCVSWTTLVLNWILPLAEESSPSKRIVTASTGLFTLYLLMSTSYELWFLFCVIIFLQCWIKREITDNNLPNSSTDFLPKAVTEHSVTMDDLRKSFIYLLMITLGFFGTGSVASLNSFERSSIFSYMKMLSKNTVFSLKVVIPFIVVACGFHLITSRTGTRRDGVFLLLLMMSDFMAIDYGSWLDIGTSISHYVITLVTTLVLIILSQLSQFIMTYRILPSSYYDDTP